MIFLTLLGLYIAVWEIDVFICKLYNSIFGDKENENI